MEFTDISDIDDERFLVLDNDGVTGSMLVIKKVRLSDRGFYKCTGKNEKMTEFGDKPVDSKAYVRVKDKMAPLWPAIGIVVQIVVLALIIVISEKRRNQNEIDESDTDEGPEKKEDSNFIRH